MSLENILLGLLQKPATGYELKAAFDGTVRHFWAAELSQIYPALHRLQRAGLLVSKAKASDKGPARKVYSLTPAGRRRLKEWLRADPQFADERVPYVAQLYFMAALRDLKKSKDFVSTVKKWRQAQLATYERINREWHGTSTPWDPDAMTDNEFHWYLTLSAGMAVAKARIAWCDDAITMIERRRISCSTRNRSCSPDRVGSVTTSASDPPVSAAMTGQPTPGGSSKMVKRRDCRSPILLARARTWLTSFPEFAAAT